MKSLLSTSFILCIFCSELASAYTSPSSAGTGWGHNNNAVVVADAEKKFKQPPANIEIDDIFREEYQLWAKRYGKSGKSVGDRSCFENFKLNFMLQMQHNKKTGTFNLLNEFGDMSAQQFDELMKGKENDGRKIDTDTTDKSFSKKTNGVAVKAEIVIEKAATVTAPIPKVSILGPTSEASPMKKNRNRNNPRSAGLVDQTRNSNIDKNRYTTNRSHRKLGPDRAPYINNNDNNNINAGSRRGSGGGFAGVDKASGPRPRRNRRLVRWVGPDKIL